MEGLGFRVNSPDAFHGNCGPTYRIDGKLGPQKKLVIYFRSIFWLYLSINMLFILNIRLGQCFLQMVFYYTFIAHNIQQYWSGKIKHPVLVKKKKKVNSRINKSECAVTQMNVVWEMSTFSLQYLPVLKPRGFGKTDLILC